MGNSLKYRFWTPKKVKVGRIFACLAGIHVGKLLIYIQSTKLEHGFLSVPEMVNLWVPKEKFDFGIRNGILEFVEDAQKNTVTVALAQFKANGV